MTATDQPAERPVIRPPKQRSDSPTISHRRKMAIRKH